MKATDIDKARALLAEHRDWSEAARLAAATWVEAPTIMIYHREVTATPAVRRVLVDALRREAERCCRALEEIGVDVEGETSEPAAVNVVFKPTEEQQAFLKRTMKSMRDMGMDHCLTERGRELADEAEADGDGFVTVGAETWAASEARYCGCGRELVDGRPSACGALGCLYKARQGDEMTTDTLPPLSQRAVRIALDAFIQELPWPVADAQAERTALVAALVAYERQVAVTRMNQAPACDKLD